MENYLELLADYLRCYEIYDVIRPYEVSTDVICWSEEEECYFLNSEESHAINDSINMDNPRKLREFEKFFTKSIKEKSKCITYGVHRDEPNIDWWEDEQFVLGLSLECDGWDYKVSAWAFSREELPKIIEESKEIFEERKRLLGSDHREHFE